MLVGSIDIYYTIKKARNRVQPTGINQPQQLRRERLQRHMLLLMISRIIIFFATTIPVSLRRIIGAYQVNIGKIIDISDIANQTAILTVLLSLNYAVSHLINMKLIISENIQGKTFY
jgi:hypothetical protein